ncbi:MAG TPA: energy-coupling factor transporter ATPase [Candidatus Aquicultor sp.]|jgi:energy-coupling factor transport system ATP-binding protein
MIEFNKVSYRYDTGDGAIEALNDITLTIREGEFVVLLGANGSGKSTFARHLNGLLVPSAGTVVVDGLSTADPKVIWTIRERVGLVFQNPDNQIIAARVWEDVAFGPENLGLPPGEIRARVDEALEVVDMSCFAQHDPHLLSGGQKQRVAIAGALAMRPQYLVLDEATSMLDPKGSHEVIATLQKLNRECGITVVLITHVPDEALLADRVVVLSRGEPAMDGAPCDIFADAEALYRIGVGVPQVQLIARALIDAGLTLPHIPHTIDELADAIC